MNMSHFRNRVRSKIPELTNLCSLNIAYTEPRRGTGLGRNLGTLIVPSNIIYKLILTSAYRQHGGIIIYAVLGFIPEIL